MTTEKFERLLVAVVPGVARFEQPFFNWEQYHVRADELKATGWTILSECDFEWYKKCN